MLTVYSISENVGLPEADTYLRFHKKSLRISEPVLLSGRQVGPVFLQTLHHINAGCLGNWFCWSMLVFHQRETHSLQSLRKT